LSVGALFCDHDVFCHHHRVTSSSVSTSDFGFLSIEKSGGGIIDEKAN